MYYIYGIKNIVDKKYYIGMSDNVPNRFHEHITYGLRGYEKLTTSLPCKKGLYTDMLRLGINKFMFMVLEIVNTDDKKEAFDIEEKWIKTYNSINKGYNTVNNARLYRDKSVMKFNAIQYKNQCGNENIKLYNELKHKAGGKPNFLKNQFCVDKFVYEITDDQGRILHVNNRLARDEEELKERLKYSFINDKKYNSRSKDYIDSKGGFDSFSINIIKVFKKDQKEEISSFIRQYKDDNHKQFIFNNNNMNL